VNNKEKAMHYTNQIYELAELIEEYIEDNDYDGACAILIDLQYFGTKLDKVLDELID
jgi:protein-arginine kinase activator protein McsA